MGLIVDSTGLIAAERSGANAQHAIAVIGRQFQDEDIGISVISLVELAHGVARAQNDRRALARRQFLLDLQAFIPIYFVSAQIAIRAGEVDGYCASQGDRVALSDLLIGVTALELGFRVATHNIKHFSLIPGLEVVGL